MGALLMARRGRYWAACLTAAVAAGSGDPLAAGSPYPSARGAATDAAWAGPLIVPGPSGRSRAPFDKLGEAATRYASESPSEPPAIVPTERIAPPAAGFPTPPMPLSRGGTASSSAPQSAFGWVAVFGDVERPGSYELSGATIAVGELIERCGVDPNTDGTLRLVRNGRPFGQLFNPQDKLLPGDVVVAQANPNGRSATARPDLQVAFVNLFDRPIALRLPSSHASVEKVLAEVVNQRHMSPRDVTVLVGGSREVGGDHVVSLTSGSVLVFNPRAVNAGSVPALPTRYFPAAPPVPAEPAAAAPALIAPPAAPSRLPAGSAVGGVVPPTGIDAFAAPPSLFPPPLIAPPLISPPIDDLSALPEVEMLGPPSDEVPLRYPRTADASGAVPIGPPEADSHIVPIPTDSIYGTVEPIPVTPTATAVGREHAIVIEGLPLEDEVSTGDDATFADMAPTILIGCLLGSVTFVLLRRLRGGRLFERPLRRIAAGMRSKTSAPHGADRANAPAEMLAALVANRLAFREESLRLPAALRVDGRSTALLKRRIDPPAVVAPAPHVPMTIAAASRRPEERPTAISETPTTSRKSPTTSRRMPMIQPTFRVDAPQPIAAPNAGRTTGTPFERALAALNAAENGD